MPPPLQYPLINGVKYDWSSISLAIGTLAVPGPIGFKSLRYKWDRKPKMVRGIGHAQPVARTRGPVTFEGDWEMWTADDAALIAALQDLQEPDPDTGTIPGLSEWTFDVQVSYRDYGQPLTVDTLVAVNLIGGEASLTDGEDATSKKRPLSMMRILENGIEVVSNVLPGS